MRILSSFSNYLKLLLMGYNKQAIDKAFNDVINKHGKTLKKLDKYDTGELKKSRNLARYSSVRDYLREVQRSSS